MTDSIIYNLSNYFSQSGILILWSLYTSGRFVDFDMEFFSRQQLDTTNQFSVTDL